MSVRDTFKWNERGGAMGSVCFVYVMGFGEWRKLVSFTPTFPFRFTLSASQAS